MMADADEGDTASGPIGFFQRLRKGVSTVGRPVPGSVKAKAGPSPGSSLLSAAFSSLTPAIGKIPPSNSSSTETQDSLIEKSPMKSERKPYRIVQFEAILQAENIDSGALRKLSWNGVPPQYRPIVWQLLLGYLPTNKSRREQAIIRKRKEYADSIPIYFNVAEADRTAQELETLRQILKDLHRLCPDMPFFQQEKIQKSMERILFIWSIRHPASGYVQGIDDILTPLLFIAMYAFTPDVLRVDVASLDEKILMDVEGDAYWCLTKLLDNIQDHYTFSQPGLQRMMLRLEDLVHRLDAELHEHFEREGLQYIQFSFRWMNCLLLRELPLRSVVRVWDTYLSEEVGGFENFHVYVCAVFLKTYKTKLLGMNFQELLVFLQEMPTQGWGEDEVEPILSQAYILSTLFDNSPSHLS